ncbi:MAG: hypothetical protein KGH85_09160, partial [Thaumarchaeota archaeon]|nr:hypothetical protein [Nitrososphaerota archaeon]
SREKSEMFSMFFRLQYSLQREFDGELGSVNYSMVERENYKIISIPTSSNIVIIGTSADVNHMEVINRVKILIQDSVMDHVPTVA